MNNTLQIIEKLPLSELNRRHDMCRKFCLELSPNIDGLMIFSRLNIYYMSGTLAHGFLWLPMQGDPVLFTTSSLERCYAESPLNNIEFFNSFDECVKGFACNNGATNLKIGAEMGALPWDLSNQLQKILAQHTFIGADIVLSKARSRKSIWELNKIRIAGKRHNEALCALIPQGLKVGMSERDVARLSWDVFFSVGHGGINRLGNLGEECFLGHIAAGDNGNYPSHFNGPLGLMGDHPATPCMGNANSFWQKGQVLALDIGFILEGYHTDKTQVYFAGKAANMPDNIKKAHDACIEIQDYAAKALKVGAIPSEIWIDAKNRAEKLGISEGFMGLGKNKVPFLGHGIGLVIDEYPVLAHRFDEPLQEGMTIAIEPKVGISGVGMVGVENTFEVGLDGAKSLTGQDFDIICVE